MQQTRFAQQQQQLMLQQQQQQQQQLQQQQIIANAVQQSVDSAMQRMSSIQHIPASPHTHIAAQTPALPAAASMNVANLPQQAPSFTVPSSPHPGLDARGPYWHVHGPHLTCRNTPCGSLSFCQGCGTHGHTSAECRRRTNPGWNASGYYSDRYPGAGPLQYRPQSTQLQQFATPPPQTTQLLQQNPPFQQPRIAPPPVYPAQSNPFPTPHKMNNINRSHPSPAAAPISPAPSARVNVSTQSAVFPSAGGGNDA
jgi:hypothetical protein